MSSFSLYVHIPYCQAKCPYCDFNSHAAAVWPEEDYTAALCAELRHYAQREPWASGRIETVFFGGGTPSLFSPGSIARILEQASQLWDVAPAAETTLEANPGTVSRSKLDGLRAAGINRVSFGVQSFAGHHLRTLGRIHGAAEAEAAVGYARDAGFSRLSIDLIFALPQQTLDEWEADLIRACELRPEHISAYNLTYEEGTAFHQWRAKGLLQPLPEEIEVAMFTRTQQILAAAGYAQYEISNYARRGEECRHNLNYWRYGPYLGVGAGAHSYSGSARSEASGWGERWSNAKLPSAYMGAVRREGHARVAGERLDLQQARGELVFLGLRCLDGFHESTFQDRFGESLTAAFPHAEGLVAGELLECVAGRWRLTPRGLLLADSVFSTFL